MIRAYLVAARRIVRFIARLGSSTAGPLRLLYAKAESLRGELEGTGTGRRPVAGDGYMQRFPGFYGQVTCASNVVSRSPLSRSTTLCGAQSPGERMRPTRSRSWWRGDGKHHPVGRALMALGGMLLIAEDLWDKRPETTWDYVGLVCLMVLVVWWAVWAIVDAVRLRGQADG
jgi:hypothetical protein